jgi:hypothetical protein
VLPFPYRDSGRPEVALTRRVPGDGRKPRVGVVDAGGDARGVLDRLAGAGYETAGITAGIHAQEPTVVWWRPAEVTREAVARVAGLVGADDRREVGGVEPALRPVLEADAPVVVVVGSR